MKWNGEDAFRPLGKPIAIGSRRLLFFMDFCFACCVRVLLIYYFYCPDNEAKWNLENKKKKKINIYMYMVCLLHLTFDFYEPAGLSYTRYINFVVFSLAYRWEKRLASAIVPFVSSLLPVCTVQKFDNYFYCIFVSATVLCYKTFDLRILPFKFNYNRRFSHRLRSVQ